MDYDDDDYEQYQQYEDELYKDSSDKSEEGSDAGDSEFEDTMLSHIHYSTNVYKKIESTAKSTGETQDSETTGSMAQTSTTMNVPSETDHLAAPPTAVDGYFMAVNQGTELDSENDEGIIKASSANARNPIVIEDEEDSRYSVEKKKDGKWNQQNAASAATHTQDQEDSGSTSESEGSSASSDEMQVNGAHGTEDSSDNEYQLEDSDGLDEHVLEFSKDSQQEEPNDFDLEAELGHLEDKKFLGKNRYYMEKTANQRACYNCGQTGHVSRDCTTMVCHICGAVGEHLYNECPAIKCLNCLKTGHTQDACPKPRGHGRNTLCSKCHARDHPTEDCPSVWREYVYTSDVPLQKVIPYCYNCGGLHHFGDDCNRLRPSFGRAGSAFTSRNGASGPLSSSSSSTHHQRYQDRDRGSSHYGDNGSNSSSSHRSHRDSHDSSSSRYNRRHRDRSRSLDRDRRDRDRERYRDRDRDYSRDGDGEHYDSRSSRSKREKRDHRDSWDSRDSRDGRDSRNGRDGRDSRDSRSSSRAEQGQGTPRMDAMAPTMANGGTVYDPIVIDSPSGGGSSSSSQGRLHPSLPMRPSSGYSGAATRIPSNNGERRSFAEQNAFPRGGGGYSQPGLIGVSSRTGGQNSHSTPPPPAPMYTGGYSQRR